MITRFAPQNVLCSLTFSLLVFVAGCGSTATVIVTPTASATSAVTATATMPPATTTPAGVCNAADFPTKSPGGPPTSSNGSPPTGFQYPPSSYYYHVTDAAGTYYYLVCSPSDPTAILAFMRSSVPAGQWTVTASTATALAAVQSNVPQEGLCASIDITVGSHPGYPGEWDATFHSPTSNCHPS